MSSVFADRRGYLVAFLASVVLNVVQCAFVLPPQESVYADMGVYLERAMRLSQGAGNSQTLDSFYPAGTSALYAIAFSFLSFPRALRAIALAQAIALAFANLLLGLTVERAFRSRRAGVLSSAVATAYWPFAALGSFYLAEPFFIFFLLLGQWLVAGAAFGQRSASSGLVRSFSAGLSLALASLIKSQGALLLVPALFAVLRRPRMRKCLALALLLGYGLGAIPQIRWSESGLRLGAANDAFNIYLGQSRRQGVAAYDARAGELFVFFNNNSNRDYLFYPPEVVHGSILDRRLFLDRVRELWRADPLAQILASLENGMELWLLRPSWPLSSSSAFLDLDLGFQWLGLLAVTLPALYGALPRFSRRRGGLSGRRMFFILPLLGITAISMMTTGQPRYLIPFYYELIPLAVLGWREAREDWRESAGGAARSFGTFAGVLLILFLVAKWVGAAAVSAVPLRGRGPTSMPALTMLHPSPVSRPSVVPVGALETEGFVSAFGGQLLSARETARVVVPLETSSTTHVAVALNDPDGYFRAALVRSAGVEKVAQQLHSGSWIVLSVTDTERRERRKEILFQKLLGDSILLSGVIAYDANKEPEEKR